MSFFKKFFGDGKKRTVNTSTSPAVNASNSPVVNAQNLSVKDTSSTPSATLAKHGRLAWIWEMSDGEGPLDSTRTGGSPIMAKEEAWPTCGSCNNPLTFKMQCNLDKLPAAMQNHGSGILRFFYCLHQECEGMGGWEAFDPQHHLSVLPSQSHGQQKTAPEGTILIQPQFLSDVIEVEDFPHWADRLDMELPESDEDIHTRDGHKFAGWPYWVQGAERPQCPECDASMEPFIQLDNDWNQSFNFGGGVGHISQCKTHKNIFAFGWACG